MLEIEEKIIWEQSLESNDTVFTLGLINIFYFIILLVSLFGIVINIYFLATLKTSSFDFIYLMMSTGFFLGALYQIVLSTKIAIIKNTLKQRITKNNIQFVYGLFRTKKIKIPFEKIANITLVKSKSTDFSTIYFNPTEKFKIVSYNFKKRKKRHCPTFEKVRDGESVYQLLMELKEKK